MTEKGKSTSFRFKKHATQAIERVEILMKELTALPKKMTTYLDNEGLLCFDYSLPNKGKYTIHILVNGIYAFTYVIDVR